MSVRERPVTVVLADDHRMFREALRSELVSFDWIDIVGEAETGDQAIDLCEEYKPDVLLLDISMPEMSGIVAIRLLRELGSETRVVILSSHSYESFIDETLKSGARGYVVKNGAIEDVVSAIEAVCNGNIYLSPEITHHVVRGYLGEGKDESRPVFDVLSRREQHILQLVAEGHSSQEIAEQLHLSKKTVDHHRASIMEKLDIHDLPSLVRYAIRAGIIEP